jgi:hypothetical protein
MAGAHVLRKGAPDQTEHARVQSAGHIFTAGVRMRPGAARASKPAENSGGHPSERSFHEDSPIVVAILFGK